MAAGAVVDFANQVDKKQTALMLAAAQGHVDVMATLVCAGADLDRADSEARTPLNYAFSQRHGAAVAWMKNKGATMRLGRHTQGFDAELTERDLGGPYSPADDPEVDARSPRYIGPQ